MTKKTNKSDSINSKHASEFIADGNFLTWPIRRFRKLWHYWRIDAIINRFMDRSSKLSRRIAKFEGSDFREVGTEGERITRQWPSAQTMSNPIWWLRWIGQFAYRWLVTRPYLPMILGLPGLAIALSLGGAVTAGSQLPKGTEAVRYKLLLAKSIEEEDYTTAKLCSAALLNMYPDNVEHLYNQGLVYEAAGDLDAAKETMLTLATERKSARAATWLAKSIGDIEEFSSWTAQQRADYLDWLTLAAKNDPTDLGPIRLKGRIQRLTGNYRGAYETLLPIADSDPETTYLVAFLERELGMPVKARDRASRLQRVFSDRLEEDSQDLDARLQYASMLVFVEQYDTALRSLAEGLATTDDPTKTKRLKTAMVDTMVVQSSNMYAKSKTPLTLMKSLQLLRDAMAIDPTNPKLVEAVAQATIEAAESKNNELTTLREALVQGVQEHGVAADTSHFILGTIALNEGNIEKAANHLDIAAKTNPNLPGLLNNLAYAIVQSEKPDLERALRLSNSAIRSLPNHPYLRETRGQILLKLRRYSEAIADLEFALAAKELRPQIRKGLVTAYQAIGENELANRHRQLAAAGK